MYHLLSILIYVVTFLCASSAGTLAEERDIPPAIQEDLQKLNSILDLSDTVPDDPLKAVYDPLKAGRNYESSGESEAARLRRSQTEPKV